MIKLKYFYISSTQPSFLASDRNIFSEAKPKISWSKYHQSFLVDNGVESKINRSSLDEILKQNNLICNIEDLLEFIDNNQGANLGSLSYLKNDIIKNALKKYGIDSKQVRALIKIYS